MLVSIDDVEKLIHKYCREISFDFDQTRSFKIISYMKEQYNIPVSMATDMITLKKPLSEFSSFCVFCLVQALDKVLETNHLKKFFTNQEINFFSNEKFGDKEESIFPISIKCVPVTSDQWIGVIDTNFLMALREKQITRYNENTQRVLERVVRNNVEQFKIAVNRNAVDNIQRAMQEGVYIPDDLTLNIPVDEESDFYYDAKKCELVINNVKALDIADGYHRLLAIYKVKEEHPEYNAPMEVRITNFMENKVRQFIYQKDQKTKMRKIDSDSMNMDNSAVLVAERLNQDILCNYHGLIGRNHSIIPLSEFVLLIDRLWFKDIMKKGGVPAKKQVIPVTKEIKDKLNLLSEEDPSLLETRFAPYELALLMIHIHSNSLEELVGTTEFLRQAFEKCKNTPQARNTFSRGITKPYIAAIEKLLRRERSYVQ